MHGKVRLSEARKSIGHLDLSVKGFNFVTDDSTICSSRSKKCFNMPNC